MLTATRAGAVTAAIDLTLLRPSAVKAASISESAAYGKAIVSLGNSWPRQRKAHTSGRGAKGIGTMASFSRSERACRPISFSPWHREDGHDWEIKAANKSEHTGRRCRFIVIGGHRQELSRLRVSREKGVWAISSESLIRPPYSCVTR